MADYKEAPLATRPHTLDPNEYFNLSPEFRRHQQDRLAMQAKLKRQYQLQLNNPLRKEHIDDPALNRWVFARNNAFEHFRPTLKTSLLGAVFGLLPLVTICYLVNKDRDIKEQQIKAGKPSRKFQVL